jgi:hypothetical protein
MLRHSAQRSGLALTQVSPRELRHQPMQTTHIVYKFRQMHNKKIYYNYVTVNRVVARPVETVQLIDDPRPVETVQLIDDRCSARVGFATFAGLQCAGMPPPQLPRIRPEVQDPAWPSRILPISLIQRQAFGARSDTRVASRSRS